LDLKATDSAWEAWGRQDPYFGVITDPRFRRESLTPEAKQEFFDSGRTHVEAILSVTRAVVVPAFSPKRVLDFGCGVGRLVMPFAKIAEEVIGMDVSDAMLTEAAQNCAREGISNARFVKSSDELAGLEGSFDLIHSFLVFQHIPIPRGRLLLRGLLSHLKPGGVGVLDFAYGKSYFPDSFGRPVAKKKKGVVPTMYGKAVGSLKTLGLTTQEQREAESRDPEMQMNAYNLSEIFFLLKQAGVLRLHAQFMDHGGEQAVLLFFQKPEDTPV
jgi:SAM-dependent methyltransferase